MQLLFNLYIYIKGYFEDIVNQNVGCKVGHYRLNVLAYADDIVLLVPSLKGLQKLIDILGESIINISP